MASESEKSSVDMMDVDCLHDEDFLVSRSNSDDTAFDTIIGHIEDIIMDEEFQEMQTNFMETHFHEFEDTEENKFVYTDIHKQYTNLVEKYIEDQLMERMPTFSMEFFQKQLRCRKDELAGEVFEILLTFSDFIAFKEMFLDYKADKNGRLLDFSGGLTVTSLAVDSSLEPMLNVTSTQLEQR